LLLVFASTVILGFILLSELVKLLLVFTSTVIPGFNLLDIHDQDFYYLLNMDVF
jgi:hypothetical protein